MPAAIAMRITGMFTAVTYAFHPVKDRPIDGVTVAPKQVMIALDSSEDG